MQGNSSEKGNRCFVWVSDCAPWHEVSLRGLEQARRVAEFGRLPRGRVMELCQVDDDGWVLERWQGGDLVALEAEAAYERCPVAGMLGVVPGKAVGVP